MLRNFIKKILQQIRISLGLIEIKTDLNIIKSVAIESYISRELRNNHRYQNAKRLNKYEYQIYSQFGEDGIINEIFSRVGTLSKFFVEIGAGEGIENNTTNLLTNNWKGVWIECDSKAVELINKYFSNFLKLKKLLLKDTFVTAENIEKLFKSANIPKQFDLLSIDIDGNDYWVWKTLKAYKPRVVVIEYNPSLGPSAEWIMKYDANHKYDYTNYHGSSLKSLELLGKELGYGLVGCSMSGVNAFFVRKDLIGKNFLTPSTSQNFYEPPRYYLYRRLGHTKNSKIFKDFIAK
jgi:hypothetical protein